MPTPALEYLTTDDGQRLAYRRRGDGGEVLIAPALCWLGDDLDRLAEGRTLVCYDHRGQGHSDPAGDDRIGFDRDVRDLEQVRHAVGAERVSLLGWSYHGAVTAHYAHRHPDRVRRMVLAGPVAPRAQPHWRSYLQSFGRRLDTAALRRIEELRRAGAPDHDPQAFGRAHVDLLLRVYVEDPACLGGMRSQPAVAPNLDIERVNRQMLRVLEQLGDYDWRTSLRDLALPVLILHGAADPVPIEGSREWLHVLRDGRLEEIPGCGHLAWLEQPDRFFPPVEAFLAAD